MNTYMGYLLCQYSSLKLRININGAHGGNVLYANNCRSNPGNPMKMPWLCLLCKMCDARE